MKVVRNICCLFAVIFLISCDDSRVFDQYKTFDDGWSKDSIVTFDFNQTSLNQKQNLYINLRTNNDYKYDNIFLIVSLEHPNGFTKVDTLQYKMANPDGTLLGQGFTDVKESKLFFKENFKFPKSGKYKIKVQQAVRKTGKIVGEKKLDGITAVGFRIEKST